MFTFVEYLSHLKHIGATGKTFRGPAIRAKKSALPDALLFNNLDISYFTFDLV